MLDQKLKDYAKQDIYPFHMPGHKRNLEWDVNPYEIDITEIDGFDNLHEAREIIKDAQEKAARIYGAKNSFYLVNGSTCGILAAISACVKKQGKIIVARNSHKSVYNGVFLRELEAVYAYPEITGFGIQGQIKSETIKMLLEDHPDAQAVLITCPTYDGILSDVKAIAEIVHQHGIPLIVDGAHGAHLGFSGDFPENPVRLGADIVIESIHKTLPAFTQTALLHICSDRVSVEKVKKYLSIYETSSPSYVLMAGIDRCMALLEQEGTLKLEQLSKNLDKFYAKTRNLKNIKVMEANDLTNDEAFDFDKSKILIFSKKDGVSGNDLHQIFLKNYHLQMEMVCGQYVLALTSLMDTEVGLERLAIALDEIDKSDLFVEKREFSFEKTSIYRKQNRLLSIVCAEDAKRTTVNLEEAVGKVAGEYVYLYPPGIPLLVPGEEITQETIRDILDCQKKGLYVEGLCGKMGICIVNFS